jgi:glucose-1-phosphate adenylyltransferase
MDGSRLEKGVRARRVIVDRFNLLPRDMVIGEDPDEDARRFHRDPSGIVVLPRGGRMPMLELEEAS